MDYSSFKLTETRQKLIDRLDLVNALLDELETESAGLDGWAKKQFNDRLRVLDALIATIVEYDQAVCQYVNFHPNAGSVEWYKEKLAIARKYVHSLGGDWQTVTWGKLSDYK